MLESKKEEIGEVLYTENNTLDSLLIKANDIALHSKDFTVKNVTSENVRMNEVADLSFIAEEGGVYHLPMSKFSLGQLGTKIGVPVRYIEKCVDSGRISLAQDNVNSWLDDYGRDLFIREHQGRIRGILSSKYSVCDSHDILNVVDSVVDSQKYDIRGSFLNEERLHVRMVNKNMLPIDGEDLFAGLFIDSSDVGRSILTVKFGIYKQVCTNGLIICKAGGVLFQQRHIGIKSEEFFEGLKSSLGRVEMLTDKAIFKVKEAKQSKLPFKVNNLTEDDFEEINKYLKGITNLPKEGVQKVLELTKDKYEDNKWGLINSITEVAQDYTLERRLELEKIAGNLLVA